MRSVLGPAGRPCAAHSGSSLPRRRPGRSGRGRRPTVETSRPDACFGPSAGPWERCLARRGIWVSVARLLEAKNSQIPAFVKTGHIMSPVGCPRTRALCRGQPSPASLPAQTVKPAVFRGHEDLRPAVAVEVGQDRLADPATESDRPQHRGLAVALAERVAACRRRSRRAPPCGRRRPGRRRSCRLTGRPMSNCQRRSARPCRRAAGHRTVGR